jgi:hypothetical protein
VSERDAAEGGQRRKPPPEWSQATGDSVFPRARPDAGVHDGRTEPDHDDGWNDGWNDGPWDHPTRIDGGAGGSRDWDHPTRPGPGAERTLLQPGYPGAGGAGAGGRALPPPPVGPPPGRPRRAGPPTAAAGYAGAGYAGGGRAPAPPSPWDEPPPGRQAPAGGPMQRRSPAPAPRRRSGEGRDDRGDDGRPDPSDRSGRGLGFPLGFGTLLGVAGLVAVVLSLTSLPWFTVAGQDVGLPDIREAFTLPETEPGDVVPGAGEGTGATVPSSIPTPGEVTDAVEQGVRNAAGDAAASAVDTGKDRYLEFYAEVGWMAVAGVCAVAVLFATVLSPKSFALSLILGFRRLSGALVVLAGIAHGGALWVVFTGDGPTPATGVWAGVGGLAAVFLACVIGPKR